jgi:DNA-binding FadR family transcriptional regulator
LPAQPFQEPADVALAKVPPHERPTPALIYRALLRGIRDGSLPPGARLPNERDLAHRFGTGRTAVRAALAMMERQGLVLRRVGSGTFLADDADRVFVRMDQTDAPEHQDVPSLAEIAEGRLLFEPAMMHLVVGRAEEPELQAMRQSLRRIQAAASWLDFKESIYALHRQIFASTKNRFLVQVMDNILADRREVDFDGQDVGRQPPAPVREQTHGELKAIVDAITARDAPRAERLVADHLTRMLATINIWR